ncbi:MAG: DUF1698 domain-containing protein, partial [Desulfobacteraceae bacterium]
MRDWIEKGKNLFAAGDFWPQLEPLFQQKIALIFQRNKNANEYTSIIETLPRIKPSSIHLAQDKVIIGCENDANVTQRGTLHQSLRQLMPWRKGPFELFGMFIDS